MQRLADEGCAPTAESDAMLLRVNTIYRSDTVLGPSAATQELAKHREQLRHQELGRPTRSKPWRMGGSPVIGTIPRQAAGVTRCERRRRYTTTA